MHRVPRRRLLAAILAAISIAAIAVPPIGGIAGAATGNPPAAQDAALAAPSASPPPTVCPDNGEGDFFCQLVISAPESVLTSTLFTVQVRVTTDGVTLAKTDPCGATVVVSLGLTEGVEGPVTTYTAAAKAGLATFSLMVGTDNFYSLRAFVEVPEAGPCADYTFAESNADFASITVPADLPIAPCPDNVSCSQAFNGAGTAATLIAEEGLFTGVEFETFSAGSWCGIAPAEPTNSVLSFGYSGSSPKTIVLALARQFVTIGIAQFKICWRQPTSFIVLGGGQSTPGLDGLHTGYLPDCKRGDLGPCVLFKKSNQLNTGFFGILAPPGDPKTAPVGR
jgi:hypothetical protein